MCRTREECELWARATEARLFAKVGKDARSQNYFTVISDLVTLAPTGELNPAQELPHSVTDLLASAIPTNRASGVYFLIEKGEVTYIGQSSNVLSRIDKHRQNGRPFDAFTYMECPKQDLDHLEALYIQALKPRGNISAGRRRAKQAEARLEQIREHGCATTPDDEALNLEPAPGIPAS